MIPITFTECQTPGYPARTRINAGADVTLAFAVDFSTAGEVATKREVLRQGKLYIPISLLNSDQSYDRLERIAAHIPSNLHSFNIAGNGIYTLRSSQVYLDEWIRSFLDKLFLIYDQCITSIVSGGQTGVDEAGLKAGRDLGITTVHCTAPKGWLFRDKDGKEWADEQAFKARFLP